MNVYLMHRAQDFLPPPPPPQADDLIQDLELETLFQAMARGDKFLLDVARQALLASLDDPDAIRYRQDILRDCLAHPAVVREIYNIPIEASEQKHKRWLGVFSRYPTGILSSALEMLEMYVAMLKKLRGIADARAGEFQSEGFGRFFRMIREELADEYFARVDEHLQALRFRDGVLLSAALGRGNEGAQYMLGRRSPRTGSWLRQAFTPRSPVYSFTIHPRDDHGARAIGELRDRGLNLVANAVAQSAEHVDGFFNNLRTELAFYIGCLNLAETLTALGEPICFPEPLPPGARGHAASELYDPCLCLTMAQPVVGNDLALGEASLVMITGANQGGKSTFLRAIGVAQLMMQCGMFVPAIRFQANVCSGVFTHYRREEDASMKSGKLDEELGRMSILADHIRPEALVLFNESFSATNEREGSEIARQIVRALLDRRVKVFYVTHMYELARSFAGAPSQEVQSLRAGRLADGRRTFKLEAGEPLPTSFGRDLYQQVFGPPPENGS